MSMKPSQRSSTNSQTPWSACKATTLQWATGKTSISCQWKGLKHTWRPPRTSGSRAHTNSGSKPTMACSKGHTLMLSSSASNTIRRLLRSMPSKTSTQIKQLNQSNLCTKKEWNSRILRRNLVKACNSIGRAKWFESGFPWMEWSLPIYSSRRPRWISKLSSSSKSRISIFLKNLSKLMKWSSIWWCMAWMSHKPPNT